MLYANSLIAIGLLISLAILVVPAIGMAIYWWWEERRSERIDRIERERAEERRSTPPSRAA